MEQLPRSNEGFTHPSVFTDSQQYNAYDNLFPQGGDQNAYDASWGINASNYPGQSRAQNPSAPGWPQSANHLSAPSPQSNINGQVPPYARSLSHSPVAYGQNAFTSYVTPANFSYHSAQPDPSFAPPQAFNQNFNYSTTDYQIPNAGTIAPHALSHQGRSPSFSQAPYNASPYTATTLAPSRPSRPAVAETVDPAKLIASIPAGQNGGRFSIIKFDDLAKATTSERMGNFVNVGTEALHWDVNRAVVPPYVPRKSRNDLRKLAANDPKLLARLGKTAVKKQRALAPLVKSSSVPNKASSPTTDKIKYEGDTPSEEVSSSSETDDDSSYTSDEEEESPPLPEKRPDSPKGATEFDTIKALWRGKRSSLASDSIRKGLGSFWDIVKTIRDRWKADVAAVQDAETKNRTNELPLLQSRVKDQRDMLETAFKAALKHGHRAILELMSENVSLLYLCYQFLLDRAKMEDYNSPLPRVMLETISLFTTLSDQKLEQTHLVKVLPRYIKKGDAKTQFYAKKITANAATKSKEKTADETTKKKAGHDGGVSSPTTKKAEPESVAGVKRPAGAIADGQMQKKVATGTSKVSSLSAAAKQGAAAAKKLPITTDSAKAMPGPMTAAAKTKSVAAKPSGLFSSLQSAAKKPGTSIASKAGQLPTAKPADKASITKPIPNPQAAPQSTFSFAETMANLSKPKEEKTVVKPEKQGPQETPEQSAKRLRKEARRHLRVSFKTGEDLVQIREFHHDPDEELGHDANQVRDLADVGGEGRMFKQQHNMMDIDDEDEIAEVEAKLIDYKQPSPIDFSDIDSEDRQRNYSKFGGGEVEPDSPESKARDAYEAKTLMVFYPNPKDVPPNPREPIDPHNGTEVTSVKRFGRPESDQWEARARQKSNENRPQPVAASGATFSYPLTFPNPQPNLVQATYQQPTPLPQPPTTPSNEALTNILASLKQAGLTSGPAPAPAMGGTFGSAFAQQPVLSSFPTQQPPVAPPVPNGQPDLAAILAQIQQSGAIPQPSAPTANFGYNNAPSMANSFQPPQQQQASGVYENPDRKQWREGGGNDNSAGKGSKKFSGQHPNYRTKVCKYWQEGRCQKGDACSYKHEE